MVQGKVEKIKRLSRQYKNSKPRRVWVAQLVERFTLGFSSGHDLKMESFSLASSSMLSRDCACPSPSPCTSSPCSSVWALMISQIKSSKILEPSKSGPFNFDANPYLS